MNFITVIILAVLLAEVIVNRLADRLNLSRMHAEIPPALRGEYDDQRYRQSQDYLRAQTRLDGFASLVHLAAFLAFWFLGGFPTVDRYARAAGFGEVSAGLIYVAILSLMSALLSLPFSVYHTFVIEARFGFNRTDWKTFVADRAKGLVLALAIGGPLLGGVLFLFDRWGGGLWWGCWAVVGGYFLALQFVVPTWVLPLFNKFEPLQEGELKAAVVDYARSIGFSLKNVLIMDGSRRSERANAFFTGLGKNRRIVLFDTLLARHTVAELIGVLAHEMGHYKKGHVHMMTLMAIGQAGLVLFLFSKFISYRPLFEAFFMERISVHAGLVFFLILYSPIDAVFSLVQHALSRRNEFTADRFAVETTGDPQPLADALKKLAAHNLSNLFPHPLYVVLHYSHPPIIERLKALGGKGAG